MALCPSHDDITAQAEFKAGRFNTGATVTPASPMLQRTIAIAAARFGLTPFEAGKINNIAAQALAAAGNDPQKVDYPGMRPALIKLLGAL
jgi:hypothetical protein